METNLEQCRTPFNIIIINVYDAHCSFCVGDTKQAPPYRLETTSYPLIRATYGGKKYFTIIIRICLTKPLTI